MSTLAPGSRSDGLSTTALPHAMAFGTIHSGTMHGKLNGVMHPTTPIGWRSDRTSTPPDDLRREVALQQLRHAARELDALEAALHLAGRVGQRLAVLRGDDRGQLVLAAHHRLAHREQHVGALAERAVAPRPLRLDRDRDGRVHLLDGGEIDLRGDGSGGRVVDGAGAAGRARRGAAGDDVCDAVHGLEPTTGRSRRHWGDQRAWHDPCPWTSPR